jgi:hypothetical protein
MLTFNGLQAIELVKKNHGSERWEGVLYDRFDLGLLGNGLAIALLRHKLNLLSCDIVIFGDGELFPTWLPRGDGRLGSWFLGWCGCESRWVRKLDVTVIFAEGQ